MKRGDLAGQVRRDVERPERARIVGDAGDDQPVERRRVVEVLDRAQPVVDQLDVVEARPSAPAPAARAATNAPDRTIWPPFAAAAIRAA